MWDKVMSILGGNLLGGVKDLVQTFKLPPEQQLAFDAKMAELQTQAELKRAELEAGDRKSARQRETAIKDKTPAILAYSITGGFFGVLFYMLNYEVPYAEREVLFVMLGSLGTAWTGIIAYYFGSSNSSSSKQSLIERMVTK